MDLEEKAETLSKYEMKKMETEKRVKRIHELIELVQKTSDELHEYQNELVDLLKVHIVMPSFRPRRERKGRSENDEDENSGKEDVKKSAATIFNKFFFAPPTPEEPLSVPVPVAITTETPSPVTPQTPSVKRRARAVSYDDLEKKSKVRMENFEIVDIFQLKNIDVDFVRECLEKCDITGDIKLFRQIFTKGIPKDQQIIRYLGGKNYQTKRNGLWIDDLNAGYIKHVLLKIFESSYISVNDLEHYGDNIDRFLMNQEHINSFTDDKYIEKLIAQITNIIDIKVGDK